MPSSWKIFDNEIREYVSREFPDRDTQILDVGAGSGKYRDLFYDYSNVDAIEIFAPYVRDFSLNIRYRTVYVGDAVDFCVSSKQKWDLYIIGDMLEHLSVESAQSLLKSLTGARVIVAVPFNYEQEPVNGNEHERHVQSDLNPAIVRERYPSLQPLALAEDYGVYVQHENEETRVQPCINRQEWSVSIEDLQKANIAIATPIYNGEVSYVYTRSLFVTTGRLRELGINHSLLMIQSTIEKARNILVANFLADPSLTHLLFIDSDEGWEVNDLLRLIAHDRDVIGIAGRKKVPTPAWAVNFGEHELVLDRGCLEVEGVGTGFLLIKRHVIEKMIVAYPELAITNHPDAEAPRGYYHALFQFSLFNGAYVSEDLTFCRRWKQIGGKVHIDPTAEVIHVGQYEYRGSVESLFQGDIRK